MIKWTNHFVKNVKNILRNQFLDAPVVGGPV